MMGSKTIALLLTGLLIASPSFAADITQEGAKNLQARFAKELASRKDIKAGGMKADFTGDVSVVAKDSYYETTFPSLKLTDNQNNVLNVGRIIMNMMPTPNPDEWKSSVALPSTLNYADAKAKNSGTLSLGNQKASGIWDMKLFGLKKLDANYGNVAFKNAQTKDGYSASDVVLAYDMAKTGDGVSGPVTVTAQNLSTTDAAGRTSLLSPRIKVVSQVTADKTAPKGYTQTSKAEISGITSTINLIGEKLKDPAGGGKAQLQKSLGVLTILQMSGKPVAGQDDTRSYDVVTNAQGKTLLNGVDISLLLNAASIK